MAKSKKQVVQAYHKRIKRLLAFAENLALDNDKIRGIKLVNHSNKIIDEIVVLQNRYFK